MAINVKLRIVGLYFNETVQVDETKDPTVRDVLDAYIQKHPNIAVPGGLEYSRFPIEDRDFATTFTYHYPGVFNFDGDGALVLPDDGLSLGKKTRLAGIYTLSESLEDRLTDRSVGLVWQFYVVSAAGDVKSKTPKTRGFTAFGERPAGFTLAEGDTIIWRLVGIVREPNFVKA